MDNIEMDLKDIRSGAFDWNQWAQDRIQWRELVSTVMKLRVPIKVRNFLNI
jgi:hypothetical protein